MQFILQCQGERDYQEDRYSYMEWNDYRLGLVADGHGGSLMSERLKQDFWNTFIKDLFDHSRYGVMRKLKLTVEKFERLKLRDGSTLSAVVLHPDFTVVTNLGDSSIVLVKGKSWFRPIQHHTLSNKKEKQRIVDCKDLKMRGNYMKKGDNYLNMTRSLGDSDMGNNILSKAECRSFPHSFDYVVLFSDGVEAMYGEDPAHVKKRWRKFFGPKIEKELFRTHLKSLNHPDNLTVLVLNGYRPLIKNVHNSSILPTKHKKASFRKRIHNGKKTFWKEFKDKGDDRKCVESHSTKNCSGRDHTGGMRVENSPRISKKSGTSVRYKQNHRFHKRKDNRIHKKNLPANGKENRRNEMEEAEFIS